MKNFDLNELGVQEMNTVETIVINGGGEVGYFKYTWSGTGNELIYAIEATANGMKLVANGGIWIWNQFQ